MIPYITSAFKSKSRQQKQMQDLENFQVIDEQIMDNIEKEYELKQTSFYRSRNSQLFPSKLNQEEAPISPVEYLDYEIMADDSLFGIALRCNISIGYLQEINNLSSEVIYTGQIIKIPSTHLPRISLLKQVSEHNPEDNQKKINVWQSDHQECLKFQMYYCVSQQNVKGTLSLTQDVIFFNPDESESPITIIKKGKQQKQIKFNVCISMQDINEAVYYVLMNKNGQKDYIVQILLSGIGRKEFETKYRKVLTKYKQEKKSIATIFFRHMDRDLNGQLYTEEKKKENCILISQQITQGCVNYNGEGIGLTKIPFVDLIEDSQKFNKIVEEEPKLDKIIGDRMGKLWASLEYVPTLKEPSKCLNESMYKQLIEKLPPIFRLANWYIRFDIDEDGSSYQHMLAELKYQTPLIFTIVDSDNRVFGAYISTELQTNHTKFYGTGETFLFCFDALSLNVYNWTEKNNYIIQSDLDGIAIGCGETFGLYIDQSLRFGYCNPCDTFDNPRFTKCDKFHIKHLEVWTIQID